MKPELNALIRRSLDLIQEHPTHDLSLHMRGAILTEVLLSEGERNSLIGQRRLVKLEELSTRKVLPLWGAMYPDNREPHELLKIVNTFYGNTWDVAVAQKIRSQFPHEIDEEPTKLVLEAAAMAVEVAILCSTRVNDYQWGQGVYPESVDNRDLDYPDGWDSTYCASVAFSSGASWQDNSDNFKRLEFWTWWLENAIPEAHGAF